MGWRIKKVILFGEVKTNYFKWKTHTHTHTNPNLNSGLFNVLAISLKNHGTF